MPMTKQYNKEDEEFNKVTNLLKELPHITAPPDFEMNLRRKLNGLNYKQEKAGISRFSLRKALIPVTALGTCAIALLIVFQQKPNPEAENPFVTAPKLRVEVKNTLPEVSNKDLLINPRNVTSNDVVIENSTPSQNSVPMRKSETMASEVNRSAKPSNGNIASNNSNRAKTRRFDFNGYENDVDQSLRARPGDYSTNSYYGNGQNVNFGGFNIIQGDGNDVEQLRARMDSIKRWMRENR